jgi:MraZ protein
MTTFLGQHQNRLDAKGRVSVPSAFRGVLKDLTGSWEMILKPSVTHACIEAWPVTRFNNLAVSLNPLDVLSAEYEDVATAHFADATSVEADKDGRIMLSDELLKHAGLSDAVTFMGIGETFQIWAPAAAAARAAHVRLKAQQRREALAAVAAAAAPVPVTMGKAVSA